MWRIVPRLALTALARAASTAPRGVRLLPGGFQDVERSSGPRGAASVAPFCWRFPFPVRLAAMTLVVRPTPPDHPQVLALIAELDAYLATLYPADANYIVDLAALKEPSVTFLGAWDGDTLVGCGAVRAMAAEPAAGNVPYGEIKRMFVSPARRGKRVAQRVLEALESDLQRRGIARALLETGAGPGRGPEALRTLRLCGAPRIRRLSRQRPVGVHGEAMDERTEPRRDRLRAVRPARALRAGRREARREVEDAAGRRPSRSLRDRHGRGAARRHAVGRAHQRGLSSPEGSARRARPICARCTVPTSAPRATPPCRRAS